MLGRRKAAEQALAEQWAEEARLQVGERLGAGTEELGDAVPVQAAVEQAFEGGEQLREFIGSCEDLRGERWQGGREGS